MSAFFCILKYRKSIILFMRLAFNHSAENLTKALFLDEEVAQEILDICIHYHETLSVTFILDEVNKDFGVSGMVMASYFLGQLLQAGKHEAEIQNILSCQRLN